MLIEQIDILKKKLEDQITEEVPYNLIYETSVEIDRLLVDYYKEYGIGSVKNI